MGDTEDTQQQLSIDEQVGHTADEGIDTETTELLTDAETGSQGELSDAAEPDEIADAVSAAEEKVGASDSLDEIAPAPPAPDTSSTAHVPAFEPDSVIPWWPFLTYLGAWIVLTALAVWQLIQLPRAQAAYESQVYGFTVLGGIIMTAVGPLVILTVWFAMWTSRSGRGREGLLTVTLLRGALVTLGGAVLWWAALIIIDYLRLGRPL